MTVRRLWSAAALLLGLVAIALAVDAAIAHFPSGLAVLACVILAICFAWLGISRRGAARTAGLAAAVLFLGGAIALVVLEARVIEDAVVVLAIIAALGAAREAFKAHADLPPARAAGRGPSCSTTRSRVVGKPRGFTSPTRPASAASNRSSYGADRTSSISSATRFSRAPTRSRWPEATGRRRSSR